MDKIEVLGKGDGDADELVALLDDSKIIFALVRVTEVIDESTTGEDRAFSGRASALHLSKRACSAGAAVWRP